MWFRESEFRVILHMGEDMGEAWKLAPKIKRPNNKSMFDMRRGKRKRKRRGIKIPLS